MGRRERLACLAHSLGKFEVMVFPFHEEVYQRRVLRCGWRNWALKREYFTDSCWFYWCQVGVDGDYGSGCSASAAYSRRNGFAKGRPEFAGSRGSMSMSMSMSLG